MIECPVCGSTRIASFRLDSDWGYGGDFDAANIGPDLEPDVFAEYTDDDLKRFEDNERVDIRCHVCLQCETCFE